MKLTSLARLLFTAAFALGCASAAHAQVLTSGAPTPFVNNGDTPGGSVPITGTGDFGRVALNGHQGVCQGKITGNPVGLVATFQTTVDPAYVLPWDTASGMQPSASVTGAGNFVGNVAQTGLRGFQLHVTSYTSGATTLTVWCGNANGFSFLTNPPAIWAGPGVPQPVITLNSSSPTACTSLYTTTGGSIMWIQDGSTGGQGSVILEIFSREGSSPTCPTGHRVWRGALAAGGQVLFGPMGIFDTTGFAYDLVGGTVSNNISIGSSK